MPTFIVKIREVHVNSIEVEADSAEEAKRIAHETGADGDPLELEYSHTLDISHTTAEKKS